MQQSCLMVKTKDKRKFLTSEDNLPLLKEFVRTFGAEVYRVVPAEKIKVLELKTLVTKFCDNPNYNDTTKVAIMERLLPEKDRQSILKDAAKIKRFIRGHLEKGKALSLKQLKEKYEELGVTSACLCNHFSAVRKELEEEGNQFKKLGAGKYMILDAQPA